MPEQKIILSVIGQVLATTNEKELLLFIGLVNNELDDILIQFDDELIEELKEAIVELEVRTLLPVLD